MELELSTGVKYLCGTYSPDSKLNDVDFEVEDGFKIVAFAGIMEARVNECKFINLSITHKPLHEPCSSSA